MWAIIKKEVKLYFLSPIGYVFIGLFLLISSFLFIFNVFTSTGVTFEYLFLYLASILTYIVPILTMRLFAEEKKEGTYQLLLTSPLSITKIVLGKFFSAVLILAIAVLLTFIYYIILCFFGKPQLSTALCGAVGFLLLGSSFISVGMFASSLTENQIIAGILTIAFLIFSSFLPNINDSLKGFSLLNIFNKFPTGQISLKELIIMFSFIILFILLTIITLQRKKSTK